LTGEKGENMRMIKQLRSFWILCVTTIVMACFSDAVAQTSYKVTDLGLNHSTDNFSMVMGLNNEGWAENMDGVVNPPIKSTSTTIASGRAVMSIYGLNIDLGTLGGKNSWTNYGGINDRGEAVGLSETSVPDPDGEDFCAFGTKLTCRPFVWQFFHMSALPTLGGNNGQASAINNRGQIVGISETTVQDSGCPPSKPGKIISPAFWEKGEVRALPTVAGDPDGFVQGINDQGEAVGSSGTCTGIATHAVLWENDTAFQLPDLGRDGNDAYAINDHGQAVGYVSTADGSTIVASLWQNGARGAVTNLGILPGDGAAFATGINNRGQVVGSTFNSEGWSRGFIWQDNVMTDLNTLIPKDSNLYIIAASNINKRGQISGMATVLTGPDANKIHAILLTPVSEEIAESVADFARTHPHSTVPANACHSSQRFGPGPFGR
jgi:probable HAF family extracellular repeat protein